MTTTEEEKFITKYDIIFEEILSIKEKEDFTPERFEEISSLIRRVRIDNDIMLKMVSKYKDRYEVTDFNIRVILSLLLGNIEVLNFKEIFLYYYFDEVANKKTKIIFQKIKIEHSENYTYNKNYEEYKYVKNYIIYNLDKYNVPTLEEAREKIKC